MTNTFFALLLSAICHTESNGVTNSINVTDGGSASYGVCQVKKKTMRHMGYKGHITSLWFNSNLNKDVAAKYLRYQLNRYNGNIKHAIAAYNAGSVKLNSSGQYVNQKYVDKVMKNYIALHHKRCQSSTTGECRTYVGNH